MRAQHGHHVYCSLLTIIMIIINFIININIIIINNIIFILLTSLCVMASWQVWAKSNGRVKGEGGGEPL